MAKYRYAEYSTDKTIFTVEAESILQADEALKEATGLIAAKEHRIGCWIDFEVPVNEQSI